MSYRRSRSGSCEAPERRHHNSPGQRSAATAALGAARQFSAPPPTRLGEPGFSLVEILVAVSLLSLIVLGLVAMFGQTQRAFKTTLNDTELQESGRSVVEMIGRELAEAQPANISNVVNFYVELPQALDHEGIYSSNLYQTLPGTINPAQVRPNYIQPFYFLSRLNQAWPDRNVIGTGYYVVPDTAGVGLGTLYRFTATNNIATNYLRPFWDFTNALAVGLTNASPIAQGVIHFSVRPFALNGYPIVSRGTRDGVTVYCTNCIYPTIPTNYAAIYSTTNRLNYNSLDGYDRCWFYSNAMPATVELEMGILEPQIYQKFRSMPSGIAQVAYLSNHVANVHLFRQRIPIQDVDPSAYP